MGIFGNGNNNQIGGDGSKPGSCPFPGSHPGGSSHSRGKRSPQPQWWSSNSNYRPNHSNGGGLNWNNGPGGSSYYPGGGINWNRPHGIGGSSHYSGGSSQYRPGGSSQSRGNKSRKC